MTLDPKLERDSLAIASLPLCHLRLLPDGDVDWFILIPNRANLVEWRDMGEQDSLLLHREIQLVSDQLQSHCHPTKINVANLGNMVRQFHIHVIARFDHDRAWPGPIWGTSARLPFSAERASFWQKVFARWHQT